MNPKQKFINNRRVGAWSFLLVFFLFFNNLSIVNAAQPTIHIIKLENRLQDFKQLFSADDSTNGIFMLKLSNKTLFDYYDSKWSSTYNLTYASGNGSSSSSSNSTYNATYDGLIKWGYNQTSTSSSGPWTSSGQNIYNITANVSIGQGGNIPASVAFGRLVVQNTAYPAIRAIRSFTDINASEAGAINLAISENVTYNGEVGILHVFSYINATKNESNLGTIGARTDTAYNRGKLIFNTYNQGTTTRVLEINSNNLVNFTGNVSIPNIRLGNPSAISSALTPFFLYSTQSAGTAFFISGVTGSPTSSGAGMLGYSFDGTATSVGDRLAYFTFGGSTTTTPTLINGGALIGYANANWNATSAPVNISIDTAPIGSGTRIPRIIVSSQGDIRISNLSGSGNAYACVNSVGILYRSNTTCA